MLSDSPAKAACISATRETLTEIDNDKWYQLLMRDGSVDNGNKLRTYREYKYSFKTEYYVNCNMSRGHRRTLAKFRSCNLPLAIETGRYTRPKTPVNERLCKYCNINAVEDETHFFVDYEFYSDLRYELFNSALCFNNTF